MQYSILTAKINIFIALPFGRQTDYDSVYLVYPYDLFMLCYKLFYTTLCIIENITRLKKVFVI